MLTEWKMMPDHTAQVPFYGPQLQPELTFLLFLIQRKATRW